ncbi:MAG: cytochrome c [Bacteroidia bacterium]
MKTNFRIFKTVTAIVIILVISSAFMQQQSVWKAPASADQKKNPVASNEQTLAAGKKIYNKECMSCHGKKGKGDGPASVTVGKPVGDMTSVSFHAQSDGAIFWKTATGKPPMPSFGKKLTEEQVWQIVNYMRTFNTK